MAVGYVPPFDALRELTGRSLLLGTLASTELAELLRIGQGTQGPRGRVLLHGGEDTALVVLEGHVADRMLTIHGAEHVTAIHGRGGCLGLTSVLGHPDTGREVVALDPVEGILLPGGPLRSLLGAHPAISRAVLRSVSAELAHHRREEARFAGTSTTERVLLRLVELVDRFGVPTGGTIRLDVELTQEELASWARSSRESTARVLQSLRAAGTIQTRRRRIVVTDVDGLRAQSARAERDPVVGRLLDRIG